MEKYVLIVILILLAGCKPQAPEPVATPDDGIVYVYFFNTESKCPSCVSAGNLAERVVNETFGDNDSVRFVRINTTRKENQPLVKKYSIHQNGLVVVRGEDAVNLNRAVFSTVVHSPASAADRIEAEIRKRTLKN